MIGKDMDKNKVACFFMAHGHHKSHTNVATKCKLNQW